jgi:hypothetical protein
MTHPQTRYELEIPEEPVSLYRLISGESAGAHEFASNHALEKQRAWPGRGEDVLQYRGISAFSILEQAETMALRVNEGLIGRGKSRRWTHVAEFEVDGHMGSGLAPTRTAGHISVWGEPELLASTVRHILPISSQGT